jgi:hypothetical protein
MRLTGIVTALLAAAALSAVPSAATADTGGSTVYFTTSGGHAVRAPAAHLSDRTTLPVPAAGRGGSVTDVVPSPDGRWVAQVWGHADVKGGGSATRLIVTDRHGRHARTVWSRRDAYDRSGSTTWGVSGPGWGRAGNGFRLYFSASRYHQDDTGTDPEVDVTSTVLVTKISSRHRPTAPRPVPGGKDLSYPAVDPTDGSLAAVRLDASTGTCWTGPASTTTSTIVLLDPRSGARDDLLTVTTPSATCTSGIRDLAWSPNGKEIAFAQSSCCVTSKHLFEGEIDVVAANGRDGGRYRVAVRADRRHLVGSPAWRTTHSLWFQRQIEDDGAEDNGLRTRPDLYSVSHRQGRFGAPVARTRTPGRWEAHPSFG